MSMSTHGVSGEMNIHTLATATGLMRCSQRLYVAGRASGARKRYM